MVEPSRFDFAGSTKIVAGRRDERGLEMNSDDELELAGALGAWPTGNLCNAHPSVRAMDASIKPLADGTQLCGIARTAVTAPGQNAAIHRAAHAGKAGEVLVVDGGGSRSWGPFGDILATCCRNKGIVGLVIDSTVRDASELRQMAFPVFCLGTNPSATAKTEPGEVDTDIVCGGVPVSPGDVIVADDDGVVVVPRAVAAEVAEKVKEVGQREDAIMKQLDEGKTTAEIFGLAPGS